MSDAVWLMLTRLGSGHKESDMTKRVNNNKMHRAQYCQNLKVLDYHARDNLSSSSLGSEVRENQCFIHCYFIS